MSSAYKLSFSMLRHLHIAFYLLRRAGHSRVASLAALPQFTFCPYPAV